MATFEGSPAFWGVPVGGLGSVDLSGLEIDGPAAGGTLEIAWLGALEVGGRPLDFQKKLPYSLVIHDATKTTILSGVGSPQVRLVGPRRVTAAVK